MTPLTGAEPPAATVLIVCTGNICRSAFAERLGRAYLREQLGDDARALSIVSAGTRAVVDSAMHPDTARVLSGFGAEAGNFRSRQLQDDMADQADLVLTMTRAHRHVVLGRSPRSLQRTFTLREAADLVGLLGADAVEGGSLQERLRSLVKEMAAARRRRHSGEQDDIRDPIGQPIDVHEEVGDAIAAALLPVLARVTGPAVQLRK